MYFQLKHSDPFLAQHSLCGITTARPPLCSHQTPPCSVPTWDCASCSCHNTAAGTDRDPHQSSLHLKADIVSKNNRKSFTFWNDFSQSFSLHPDQDRVAQVAFGWVWHNVGLDGGWLCTWKGVTLLFRLEKSSALLRVRGEWTKLLNFAVLCPV